MLQTSKSTNQRPKNQGTIIKFFDAKKEILIRLSEFRYSLSIIDRKTLKQSDYRINALTKADAIVALNQLIGHTDYVITFLWRKMLKQTIMYVPQGGMEVALAGCTYEVVKL